MAGGYSWSQRIAARLRSLRSLVRDTQRAWHDIQDILHIDPEIALTVQEIGSLSSRVTAIVILGTSGSAKARLLHCLLGRQLLPDPLPRGCRWLRIQYGSSTQVHLTLGNTEFELVEELVCNKKTWDTIPVEDLIRQDKTDLATMLEIELNIPFLKDGIKIIIPPDLNEDCSARVAVLKNKYSDFYTKRSHILRNFNPIYLYAVDRIGKNVFSDNLQGSIVKTKSEKDFWNNFNLYSMTGSYNESVKEEVRVIKFEEREVWKESNDSPVFNNENCLDLYQLKELNPSSQVYFMLFSDSVDTMVVRSCRLLSMEATESTEDNVFCDEDLPEADQGLIDGRRTDSSNSKLKGNRRLYEEQIAFMNDLLDQWELTSPPLKHCIKSQWSIIDDLEILRTSDLRSLATYVPTSPQSPDENIGRAAQSDTITDRNSFLNKVIKFTTDTRHAYLLDNCTKLSEIHVKLLQQFILASFDLARELQVVPKKIQYVAIQEQQLYETINEKFSEGDKKKELLKIMNDVLEEMSQEVNNMDWSVDDLPCHLDRKYTMSSSIFYSLSRVSPDAIRMNDRVTADNRVSALSSSPVDDMASDSEEATTYHNYNIDDYDIILSNEESSSVTASYLNTEIRSQDVSIQLTTIPVENESFSFSRRSIGNELSNQSICTNATNISVKQASLDVQQTVLSKLSRKISMKLVKFVDCLKDTYFGTLERCLESLEMSCRQELGGRPASEAMRQLVSVARQVDLVPCASFSLLRSLLENLRTMFRRLLLSSNGDGEACCVLSPIWRRRVASHTLSSLSAAKLASLISAQILEKLSVAHEKYQSALLSLESALANRLHHTEDVKLAIRKKYAPHFARLCLESTSMCDLLMYGTPELGREIGRGHYGVVYSVRGGWGGRSPAAVKSVLPTDERHYRELAMEFFYTRSIPAHDRIVRVYGSIVQHYTSNQGPTVLLISERRARDLYCAVRAGLKFATRMRISLDIVEGIRYLHSLGLVHRDIKLKNVLLDKNDRAALSDLGFCAAEALISGSIVGTPVHMAPELLEGEYDASVDIYAFAVLFWYVCAGNIQLPSVFDLQNKEQLWSKVKKGLRPERLPQITDDCWEIMTSCWASDPQKRALLGDVHLKLERILNKALKDGEPYEHIDRTTNECFNNNEIERSIDDNSFEFSNYKDCV